MSNNVAFGLEDGLIDSGLCEAAGGMIPESVGRSRWPWRARSRSSLLLRSAGFSFGCCLRSAAPDPKLFDHGAIKLGVQVEMLSGKRRANRQPYGFRHDRWKCICDLAQLRVTLSEYFPFIGKALQTLHYRNRKRNKSVF